jgi:hypothetical protein
MSAPTGTVYPGSLDTSTTIGTAVAAGGAIASAYDNTLSSAALAIETALATNPQRDRCLGSRSLDRPGPQDLCCQFVSSTDRL